MALDTTMLHSRRALLAGAFGGLVSVAAQALGRPLPTNAANGDVVTVGGSHQGGPTRLYSSGPDPVLVGETVGSIGVLGFSRSSGNGVRGQTNTGTGVRALSDTGTGLRAESGSGYGVHGTSHSSYGVYGESETSYAVSGLSTRSAGVAGFSESGQGAIGSSASAVGVLGQGGTGRGGRFSGRKAQIRLDPARATTHPASGAAGDLFVDRSNRLWFCRGGRSWVRLA